MCVCVFQVKTKLYDVATGSSRFEIGWVSQAAAAQRAGRAGRVAPGQCYRLYSSQRFSQMAEFNAPDILNRPIDDVVLMLKVGWKFAISSRLTRMREILDRDKNWVLSTAGMHWFIFT